MTKSITAIKSTNSRKQESGDKGESKHNSESDQSESSSVYDSLKSTKILNQKQELNDPKTPEFRKSKFKSFKNLTDDHLQDKNNQTENTSKFIIINTS